MLVLATEKGADVVTVAVTDWLSGFLTMALSVLLLPTSTVSKLEGNLEQ